MVFGAETSNSTDATEIHLLAAPPGRLPVDPGVVPSVPDRPQTATLAVRLSQSRILWTRGANTLYFAAAPRVNNARMSLGLKVFTGIDHRSPPTELGTKTTPSARTASRSANSRR